MPDRLPILDAAQFYGAASRRRLAGDFTLGHWAPDPTLVVGLHTHHDAHLVLPLGGAYRSSAWGAPTHADRSTVIYNPPGTTHRDRFDPVDGRIGGRFFTISMPPDAVAGLEPEVRLPDHPVAIGAPAVRALARRLAAECLAWAPGSDLVCESLCLELTGALAARPGSNAGASPRWLGQAVEALDAATTSIAEVARAVGLHPVAFARAFRRHLGVTPGEFRLECRIGRAEGLLETSRMPLSEIALRTGFADQSHFTRAFARRRGLPPGRYRRLVRA